ncbi:MAG: 2-succinyl-5-enolpyruvyl-6-hydroxy-3-cyclohexene-1-carboxylic-acid synthase, partial [Actinomycetota bacterium]|nr:2-succinyl-5-enolpyruvyl-6-hydroxy-3-cyclohexene-1-carboxylic-acid synthase [Actinomycetota bacterium]
MNPSTALATVLVDELVHQGVAEAVLSPGSRSAPLAYALHAADAAGRLRLHVRIDERSAAYLALGLAKAAGRPVPVVTTSGTAVANLHPAVLEADASGVPLVVLTADRPPELRGTGANQTTDQIAIFGRAVRTFVDVAAPEERAGQVAYWRNVVARACASARGSRSADPGPVHLDVALRDPLVPGSGAWVEALDDRTGGSVVGAAADPPVQLLRHGPRTVVVAGDDGGRDGSPARHLAETAGWPLLAEPSSGARCGPHALGPYRLLLEHEALAGDVERVVAFGRPTLSRPVTRLLGRRDVELVVVNASGPQWVD